VPSHGIVSSLSVHYRIAGIKFGIIKHDKTGDHITPSDLNGQ